MKSVCNKCGRKLISEQPTGSHKIKIRFGYNSKLFDNEEWQFELCDDCLDSFARSFIYPPKGFMEDPYKAYGEALRELHNVG